MNSIERVTMALNHQEPDRVPVYPLINSVSMQTLGIDYEEWSRMWTNVQNPSSEQRTEIGVDAIFAL